MTDPKQPAGDKCAALRNARLRRFADELLNPWFLLVLAGYVCASVVAGILALLGVNDAVGYLASFLVLGSFASHSMVPLRILALLSNVAFVAYALQCHLVPVLLLHAVLLPVNLWRIAQLTGHSRRILRVLRALPIRRRWSAVRTLSRV